MFENLKEFKKIIVTGPQRSGTTITAKMIAMDAGHKYVDEDDIGIKRLPLLRGLVESDGNIVVHCPALSRNVHEFGTRDDTAIVLVKRPVADIVASQRRIDWPAEKEELKRYGLNTGTIAQVKYNFWQEKQKQQIRHAVEVEYASLKHHPMWVPPEKRIGWGPRQTGAAA